MLVIILLLLSLGMLFNYYCLYISKKFEFFICSFFSIFLIVIVIVIIYKNLE